MSYKCELCGKDEAKHQYIGEAKRGEGKRELYICNECFDFLNPTPTWKSLQKVLNFQRALPMKDTGYLLEGITKLTCVILQAYDEIENTLVYDVPDFFENFEGFEIIKTGQLKKGHTMMFHKPEDDGNVRMYPFTFDGMEGMFLISLDPFNEYGLKNIITNKTREMFPPVYEYVGVGFISPAEGLDNFEQMEFLYSLYYVGQIIHSMSDS